VVGRELGDRVDAGTGVLLQVIGRLVARK